MKSTKVQNPRRNKCSAVHAVAEKNCLVADLEYRVPYRIGPRTIINDKVLTLGAGR